MNTSAPVHIITFTPLTFEILLFFNKTFLKHQPEVVIEIFIPCQTENMKWLTSEVLLECQKRKLMKKKYQSGNSLPTWYPCEADTG